MIDIKISKIKIHLFSSIEKFDLINFFEFYVLSLDFSLTNFNIYLIFILIILISLFSCVYINKLSILPYFITNVNTNILNLTFSFLLDIVNKQINKKGYKYFSFIVTFFFIILIINLFGMLPYSFPITAHISITLFFSIIVWILSIWLGLKINGYRFYKLFVPNVPLFLLPLLIVLEVVSYIIRVFSLAIRLAANITSGHILMFTIAGFFVKLIKFNWLLSFIVVLLLLFITFLELGIAFLQAYVFVTLTCIYMNDSINLLLMH